MEKFEALWAYQEEDMKADAIAAAIRRSPTRQKLEKARDFILDRQKQYKQIEEDVGAMVDRKDIIAQAIDRSREQLQVLQNRFESSPILVAGHDDMVVTHAATSLCDKLYTALVGTLNIVTKGEDHPSGG